MVEERLTRLRKRRILVTGGTGFIGSHLVDALVDVGAEVHVLARSSSVPEPDRRDALGGASIHRADLTERDALTRAVRMARPDIVFHLAAFTHVGRSWSMAGECMRVNVEGTANLLEALDQHGYERLVHASTSEVYGNSTVPFVEEATPRPTSPYGISKRAAEMLCQLGADHRDWPIVQLRVFNAYGPGQPADRIISEIISRALDRTELKMTRGAQTREFNHVSDLVEGMLLAAVVEGVEGDLMNLGNGDEISIAELATTLLGLMGNPIEAQLGALPERPVEVPRMFCDPSRARRLLGWTSSRSLRDGLLDTIDWYRAQRIRSAEPS